MTSVALPADTHPTRVSVRMYQVGFGDCFLLSVAYNRPLADGRAERHMLIDFGRTRRPKQGGDMLKVAKAIAAGCDIAAGGAGRLDAIVVTHRHEDHLSAFGQAKPAAEIAKLKPGLIVRPWTEHPDAAETATAAAGLGVRSRAFLRGLAEGESFVRRLADRPLPRGSALAQRALVRMAFDQLSNQAAIARLDQWSEGGRGIYVSYGDTAGEQRIAATLPGVDVRLLGPPTAEDWEAVQQQRQDDAEEYWMLRGRLLPLAQNGAATGPSPAPDDRAARSGRAALPGELGPERWLVERLQAQHVSSLRRIVRIMDDALNNTSVILLLHVAGRSLLFGGDAQIENWEYALKHAPDKDANLAALRAVDLYKVGHHGSRNATPRTLWNLWTEGAAAQRPLTVLMSTLPGVHGEHETTLVPRGTLCDEFKKRAPAAFYSTGRLTEGEQTPEGYILAEDGVTLSADLTTGGPFVRTA